MRTGSKPTTGNCGWTVNSGITSHRTGRLHRVMSVSQYFVLVIYIFRSPKLVLVKHAILLYETHTRLTALCPGLPE